MVQPTAELSWHIYSNLQQNHFLYRVYRRSVTSNALAFDLRVRLTESLTRLPDFSGTRACVSLRKHVCFDYYTSIYLVASFMKNDIIPDVYVCYLSFIALAEAGRVKIEGKCAPCLTPIFFRQSWTQVIRTT